MSNNDQKLDKIQEDVTDIKVTLARNTASLEEHMRRTALLESKIEPLETHADMVKGAIKLVGIIAALAAIAEVFIR